MGRRKIEIQPITHERNRAVTFLKRKNGLFKKAYELGVLCSVDVAVVIFEKKGQKDAKLWTYSSVSDVKDIVQRSLRFSGDKDNKTACDFGGSVSSSSKRDDDDDDGENEEGEDEDEYIPPSTHKKSSGPSKAKPQEDAQPPESIQDAPRSYAYSHRPPYSDSHFAPNSVPIVVNPNTGVPYTPYTYPPPSHPHSHPHHHPHLPSSHSPVYADRRPPYSDQRYQAPSPTYTHSAPYGDLDVPPAKRQRIMTGAYPTTTSPYGGYRLSASAHPERAGVPSGLDLFAGLFGNGETRGAERRSIEDRQEGEGTFEWPVHNTDAHSQRSGASASPTGSSGGQTASWLEFLSGNTTGTSA